MTEWDDVEVQSSEESAPAGRRVSAQRILWPAGIGLALIAFFVGIYLYSFRQKTRPPEPGSQDLELSRQPGPEERPEADSKPPLALPDLNASDSFVRELLGKLSSHPTLAAWALGPDLIRTFTTVVDNIAEGTSPAKHLPLLKPSLPFQVSRRSRRVYLDPRSYDRYNLAGDVFASIDAQGAVHLYRALKPLIQEAYREMGYPSRDFDETLGRAMARLLETPVVERDIELDPSKVSYRYVESALEDLTPAEKQLLRMGPRNVRKVQAKLRELSVALGSSVPATGSPKPGVRILFVPSR